MRPPPSNANVLLVLATAALANALAVYYLLW